MKTSPPCLAGPGDETVAVAMDAHRPDHQVDLLRQGIAVPLEADQGALAGQRLEETAGLRALLAGEFEPVKNFPGGERAGGVVFEKGDQVSRITDIAIPISTAWNCNLLRRMQEDYSSSPMDPWLTGSQRKGAKEKRGAKEIIGIKPLPDLAFALKKSNVSSPVAPG